MSSFADIFNTVFINGLTHRGWPQEKENKFLKMLNDQNIPRAEGDHRNNGIIPKLIVLGGSYKNSGVIKRLFVKDGTVRNSGMIDEVYVESGRVKNSGTIGSIYMKQEVTYSNSGIISHSHRKPAEFYHVMTPSKTYSNGPSTSGLPKTGPSSAQPNENHQVPEAPANRGSYECPICLRVVNEREPVSTSCGKI